MIGSSRLLSERKMSNDSSLWSIWVVSSAILMCDHCLCRKCDYVIFSAREFITRALLASRANIVEILEILTNEGAGTADGFNVNLAFVNVPRESRVFYAIEVIPNPDKAQSGVYPVTIKTGNNALHTNRSVYSLFSSEYRWANESRKKLNVNE